MLFFATQVNASDDVCSQWAMDSSLARLSSQCNGLTDAERYSLLKSEWLESSNRGQFKVMKSYPWPRSVVYL